MKVEFYKHHLNEDDKKACLEVLDSYFLTTGKVVNDFEEKFANYMQTKYAVGTSSCSNSLFLCLKYYGIQANDEVITTPMSFVATANAIERCGAKPIFVDVEKDTGNLDMEKVEAAITPKTKAIIPVHLYGQMCDMKRLKAIAEKHQLPIIEDACHAFEASREGIRVGQLGDAACFSFYATKNMTSGEGGAVVTNDASLKDWLSKARQHGITKSAADRYGKTYQHYEMHFLGYKANLNNIQAALLINQLDRIEDYAVQRAAIAKRYDAAFAENPYIECPQALPDSKHARHIYTIWVNPLHRDEILGKLQEKGVGVAINYRPIHLMHYYREKYAYQTGQFPNTERIGDSTITIPFYPKLENVEIDYVIKIVNEVTSNLGSD